MNVERVARLRRAMATLWSTRRLGGESAQPLELVTRHFVGHGLQSTGVECARYAITPVGAAVQKRLEVHCGNGAVLLNAGFDVHQHGMPSTMAIENFFARERALHRPARNHRQLAHDNFMIKGIALAAKTAAVWRGDDANMT